MITSLPSAEKCAEYIGKFSRKMLCIAAFCFPSTWNKNLFFVNLTEQRSVSNFQSKTKNLLFGIFQLFLCLQQSTRKGMALPCLPLSSLPHPKKKFSELWICSKPTSDINIRKCLSRKKTVVQFISVFKNLTMPFCYAMTDEWLHRNLYTLLADFAGC